MSPRALLFAIALMPCALLAQAETKGSNVLGQLCPELELEAEMVQGGASKVSATGGNRRVANSNATKPAVSPSRGVRAGGGNSTAPRTHSESRVQGSGR